MEAAEDSIKIGTVLRANKKILSYLERFMPAGIESVQVFFWGAVPDEIDGRWAEELAAGCEGRGITLSAMSLFANPLAGGDEGAVAAAGWQKLHELAEAAGVKLLTGFTGRIPDRPVDESIEPVTAFFAPLLSELDKSGMSLAFENCPMGGNWQSGSWNIAFSPEIWDILINDRLKSEGLGLEFDPSHCEGYGQPVMLLLKEWISRIKHLHAKDAVCLPPDTAVNGWLGKKPPYVERFPGEGSVDWTEVFRILNENGYDGTVEVEGYFNEFVSHEAEAENQKRSIEYLKKCRINATI